MGLLEVPLWLFERCVVVASPIFPFSFHRLHIIDMVAMRSLSVVKFHLREAY
jgi:hypothetical protein